MSYKNPNCCSPHGPRTSFESHEDARRAAATLFEKKNIVMNPYHCHNCHTWHLRPETPQVFDDWFSFERSPCGCTDRKGNIKAAYSSEHEANRYAQCCESYDSSLTLSVYQCARGYWHLTKGR